MLRPFGRTPAPKNQRSNYMSVPKSKRDESVIEFIATASEIHKEITTFCIKLPKRWNSIICVPMIELSSLVNRNVVCANSLKHSNKHEMQTRIDHILLAKGYLKALSEHLSLSYETLLHSDAHKEWMDKGIERISGLIVKEDDLLVGVLAYYRKLYKKTQDTPEQVSLVFGDLSEDEISLLRGTLSAYRARFEALTINPIIDTNTKSVDYGLLYKISDSNKQS